MDKREMVIEAIKKLVSLGVSDEEIIDNLFDVGIEKSAALELIANAKSLVGSGQAVSSVPEGKGSTSLPEIKTSGGSDSQKVDSKSKAGASVVESKPLSSSQDFFENTVEELSMNDQIVQQLNLNKSGSPKNNSVSGSVTDEKVPDDITEKIMADVAEDSEGSEAQSEGVVKSDLPKENDESVLSSEPVVEAKEEIKPALVAKQKKVVPPVQPAPNNSFSEKQVPEKIFSKASPVQTNPISVSENTVVSQKPLPVSSEMTPDFEELWKKGIVIAVNAKLGEMKRLKEDVDKVVQEKVDEAVRKELYQYKVLMDSQKELIISSNKDALEQKQKEIVFIIDAKIAELRQFNKQLADNLAVLEQSKKQQEVALQQISQALEDAKKTKSQLIVEMNSELIKAKSQAQAFLDSANTHLVQMDERVNKTLELEKNIADGMLQEAQQKIETLAIQRADELIANLEVELNRLQSISKNLSPETLEQKIRVLEEFRKQFLTNMQQSLAQINTAIEELNQKNILADRALQEKTLAIDAKIEELTKFEKEFTQKMDYLLSKK